MRDVAIIGVGWSGFKPTTPDLSFREMAYEAAVMAYEDAGITDPRKEIDAFVTCEEDFWAGIAIADEFMGDQLGGVLKPVYTITGDGLMGLASAYMKIRSGAFDLVVVEAHSKASDILTIYHIMEFAEDPIYNRPLNTHPYFIAGLEANYYMYVSGVERRHLAMVVQKNKGNAIRNPLASFGAKLSIDEILCNPIVVDPLSELDIAPFVDAAVVVVVASGDIARKYTDNPIWVEGVGWATETNYLETRELSEAVYAKIAADMAYKMAGIKDPRTQLDFAEIDDKFSYKELMHIEALRISGQGDAHIELERGTFNLDGEFPVNPSGGLLGIGNALEACGLIKVLEAILQLRGEAYGRQVKDAKAAVVQSWRDVPTATGAVAVLCKEV